MAFCFLVVGLISLTSDLVSLFTDYPPLWGDGYTIIFFGISMILNKLEDKD